MQSSQGVMMGAGRKQPGLSSPVSLTPPPSLEVSVPSEMSVVDVEGPVVLPLPWPVLTVSSAVPSALARLVSEDIARVVVLSAPGITTSVSSGASVE